MPTHVNCIHGRLVVARCVVGRLEEGPVDPSGWGPMLAGVGALVEASEKLGGHVAGVRFEWVRVVRVVVAVRGGALAAAA